MVVEKAVPIGAQATLNARIVLNMRKWRTNSKCGSTYDTMEDMVMLLNRFRYGMGRMSNRNLREAVAPSSGNWKYDPVGAGSSIRDMLVNRSK